MMKKRFIAVVAGVMAVLMMLTGCGNKPEETKTSVDLAQFSETNGLVLPFADGEEIEIMLPSSVADLENKLFAKTLEELTGVKLKFTVVASANYGQRLKMAIYSFCSKKFKSFDVLCCINFQNITIFNIRNLYIKFISTCYC